MNKDILNSIIIGFLVAVIFFGISGSLGFQIPYLWTLLIVFPILSAIGMVVAILLKKRFPILFQGAKFLLVGALNTIIDLGILNLLIFLSGITAGIFFSAFKAISFIVAVLNSYVWNKYWTFSSHPKGAGEAGKEFLQFFLVSTGGLLMNVGTAFLVVDILGPQFGFSPAVWANIGAIAAAFTSLAWNFLGYRLIVFKR